MDNNNCYGLIIIVTKSKIRNISSLRQTSLTIDCNMSMIAKQFIAIHLKQIRTIGTNCSGRFQLRFHIFQQPTQEKAEPQFAIPINVIQQNSNASHQHSQTNQNEYVTRSFVLKPGQHSVAFNQICVLKYEFDMFKLQQKQIHRLHHLSVCCELISIDYNSKKVVSTFEGKIYSQSGSQFICIDYYAPVSCQLTGTLHSCIYNYQFQASQKYASLQQYCAKLQPDQVQTFLKYILTESKQNQNRLKTMVDEQVNYDLQKSQINKLKKIVLSRRRSQLNTEEDINQTNEPFTSLNQIQDGSIQNRKRKKIFQKSNSMKQGVQIRFKLQLTAQIKFKSAKQQLKKQQFFNFKDKQVSIQQFESVIHSNAFKVYESWNKLLKILVNQRKQRLVSQLQKEYYKKVQKKVGESIIRFKGSYDIDTYSSQNQQRCKMAYQLRNQPLQYLKQINQFHFASNQLFSLAKPIFFQQQTENYPKLVKQTPKTLLVFLVHGLGACRLDMDKLKNELKRFYGDRITIITSTSNEGRTEGDIAAMSIRLASEVQHHIARWPEQQKPQISFVAHSMGGVISRGAFPHLKKFKHLFYSFITLSSPHLGYSYSTSKLVDAGLWVMNNWRKCQSLLQLTMEDSQIIEETLLYKMSQYRGLQWFSKVTFVSSRQDLYVPFYSARIQKSSQSIIDAKNKAKKGIMHTQMIDSILNSIKGKITRIDVNFCIKQQNMDNLIGRAAHISFINNSEVLKTFCFCCDRILF